MSGQTRFSSLMEACTNTFVGLLVSYAIQLSLNRAYNIEMSNTIAAHYVFWFTVASIARSYLLRRLWNKNFLQVLALYWKYRNVDPGVCCCGSDIGKGGSICGHGGCKSFKQYVIEQEIIDGRQCKK